LGRVLSEDVPSSRSRPGAGRFAFLWGVLAGAAAVALLLMVLMPPGGRRSEGLTPIAAELAAKHVLYAEGRGNPLELVTSDPSQVTGWVTRRLGFEVDLPHLSRADDRLVGGRVSSVADSPTAYLLYEWGGRPVSLFITRRLPAGSLRGTKQTAEGTEVQPAAFRDGALGWWEEEEDTGLLYAVATTGGETHLLRFAQLCVRSGRVSKPDGPPSREEVPTVTAPSG